MGEQEKNTASIYNPATGKALAPLREHTMEQLSRAVAAAQAAQKKWRAVSVRERARYVHAMRRYICGRAERFAEVISECTGKTRIDALSTEVIPALLAARYYAKKAERFLRPRRIRGGPPLFFFKRSVLYREPYGVVGIISPWNYPFGIPFHEVVSGLLSGNAVILKVATQAQPVGELFEELCRAARLPKNLFWHCLLPGAKAGPALLDAGIGKLFFTGSTEVGRLLARQAGERLIPVCLELGGNNPMLVLDDANLARAVGGAVWAGMSNCGQSCGRAQRIYVVRKVYVRFKRLLCERVAALTQGYAEDSSFDIGSLTTPAQFEKVKRQVEGALAAGARIVASAGTGPAVAQGTTGGTGPAGARINSGAPAAAAGGLFYPPIVLETDNHDLDLLKQEVFGPVLILVEVGDAAQAVRLANATDMGLTASVWSANPYRAENAARRIQAGAVTTNDHLMSHGMSDTPWGGYKNSGLGRAHGRQGFEEMTQLKVIIRDRLATLPRSFWWHPHGRRVYRGLLGLATMLSGKNVRQRLKGALGFLRLALRSLSRR
jgi:acyl-CoA reductase-like NAD-dependent aldehyde dehydrogenase